MLPEIQDLNEEKSPSSVWHPLDPLSRDEISLVSSIVRKDTAEEIGNFIRFETIELKEPPKNMVRAFDQRSKVEIERQAFVNAFRIGGGIGVWRMVVSITKQQVVSKVFLPKARPMIQLNEFVEIENVVKKDARVIEACAKRGITNMDMLCVDPWSCGAFGSDFEEGRHISYTFLWVKSSENDNLYAHPVDGVNAVVDIKAMDVIQVDDWCVIPIPQQESNYCQDFIKDSPSSLKPINIQQPEGVSFSIKGRMLHWYEWSLLIGFNAREGITLHNISFGGRPICYRASLAEMIVPYGSPRPPHFRKNAFDIGEYGLGRLANSLELGCDCLGAVQYLDCWINDTNGDPMLIKNGICIHEEDHGILWKHWDFRTERTEVRRARRLVISTISTVANYEYGCYWYVGLCHLAEQFSQSDSSGGFIVFIQVPDVGWQH
jgi:primary-amine oxidase